MVSSARDVVYVDAAEYTNRQSMSIVATSLEGDSRVSGSVKTGKAEVAEEAALALAIASTEANIKVSDSKTAVKNYAKGRISPEALRILANYREDRKVYIIWAPAHSSLPGNEIAHNLA